MRSHGKNVLYLCILFLLSCIKYVFERVEDSRVYLDDLNEEIESFQSHEHPRCHS